jgi:hypothetical protein
MAFYLVKIPETVGEGQAGLKILGTKPLDGPATLPTILSIIPLPVNLKSEAGCQRSEVRNQRPCYLSDSFSDI